MIIPFDTNNPILTDANKENIIRMIEEKIKDKIEILKERGSKCSM
jgi:hypothetical protein